VSGQSIFDWAKRLFNWLAVSANLIVGLLVGGNQWRST
jgi:hypothetical protein